MKTCTACRLHMADSMYRVVMHRGKPYQLPECIDCMRERKAQQHERKKLAKPSDPLNQTVSLWFGPADRNRPLTWSIT